MCENTGGFYEKILNRLTSSEPASAGGAVCPLCDSAELEDYDSRDEVGYKADDSGEGKIFGRERIGESRAYESSMSEQESYLDSEPIDVDE